MWPNLLYVLSCTEEKMRVGGGEKNSCFDKYYHPFQFMFNFYKGLT